MQSKTTAMKRARKRVGLTQVQVAKKAHISVNHYAMIERGQATPSIRVLHEISKILKVKTATILPS